MLRSEIDHLVITAATLDEGVQYIRRVFGVTPDMGGEHSAMGTHNCLVKLGDTSYLEVIAINPTAPQPNRPRWYGLDTLDADASPRLTTWVVRVNDIEAAAAASPIPLGNIEVMNRDELNWRITVPADGSLPLQGIAPTLIQWAEGQPHPASQLSDLGCSLERLAGFHPEAESIKAMLKAVGFADQFSVTAPPADEQPSLVASIHSPGWVWQLGMP
jgi:glyoxalase-like protein